MPLTDGAGVGAASGTSGERSHPDTLVLAVCVSGQCLLPLGRDRCVSSAAPRKECILPKVKDDAILLEGKTVEALKGGHFRIQLDNGHEVLGHLSGKMRKHHIRILPGDRVQVEVSAYDLTRGRITYRYK